MRLEESNANESISWTAPSAVLARGRGLSPYRRAFQERGLHPASSANDFQEHAVSGSTTAATGNPTGLAVILQANQGATSDDSRSGLPQ